MRQRRNLAWLALAALALSGPVAAQPAPPTIFAAASLEPALDQLARAGVLGSPAPRLVFAASSALARQIDDGAPADIFISADERWMDVTAQHGAIIAATRINLLGNALVLVAPAGSRARLDLAHGAKPLLAALGSGGRLAIALPDSVPAGIYAKQALTALGMWTALEPRMAMSRDVRAALNLVVLRQCPLGIVYRSGAASEPRVRVLATFPADSHKPIVYPAAIVAGHDDAAARALLAALQSPRALAVFHHWGFDAQPMQKSGQSANARKPRE